VCQHPCASEIAKTNDVPNLHRMRELWHVSGRSLCHVRIFTELALESAHQRMKPATMKRKGHYDAGHAMRRMQQTEVFSRLSFSPAYFGVHDIWVAPGIVQLALTKARPFLSHAS